MEKELDTARLIVVIWYKGSIKSKWARAEVAEGADQTFKKDDNTEIRFRYRISSEIPLQGKSLDPKEFFIKLNNEYLNSLYEKSYNMEIRGATFIGYIVSPANKLEFGFDYRIDSFINGNPRNRLWIGLNFYSSI